MVRLISLGSLLVFMFAGPAQAQVTLDVSKITCEQFWLRKVADADKLAIWLSGYFHGKRGTTIVEPQHFEEVSKQVLDYCKENLKTPLMQAAEMVVTKLGK